MAEGWIALHRRITEHWVWQKKPFSYGQAWADILLECNHDERKAVIKGALITCYRGQSINSLKTWAKRWGWTVAATRHFLGLLESDKMIVTKSERVTTRLSVCKYESYQGKQHAEQTQSNRRAIAEQTQSNTNNNDNNETMKQEREAPKKPKVKPEPSETDKRLSRSLYEAIKKIDPQYFTNGVLKALPKWPDVFRKIREVDGRDVKDIETIIAGLERDEFWSKNLRSPEALRGMTKSSGADKFQKVLSDVKESTSDKSKQAKQSTSDYIPR